MTDDCELGNQKASYLSLLSFEKRRLGNGLEVIVHESHRLPLVGISVWYHVGARHEGERQGGCAHFLEHLLCDGPAGALRGYSRQLQQVGAAVGASTSADRTSYWSVVPSNAAPFALWLESCRMGWRPSAVSPAAVETQRAIILNEQRQRQFGTSHGRALAALTATLFPKPHPYHGSVIGSASDLRGIESRDITEFHQTHYQAGNASLAIAGDVTPVDAFEWSEKYFGSIPARDVSCLDREETAVPAAASHDRVYMEDVVEQPALVVAWPSPPLFEPGDAELDFLVDLLTNGKASRLHQSLVYEQAIATQVSAAQNSKELSGYFAIAITAKQGVPLATILDAVDEELARVIDAGPTHREIARAAGLVEAHFMYRLQNVGGNGGKADQLNAYNVFRRDPGFFVKDLERYKNVTCESIRRVAAGILRRTHRVLLSVVPRGRTALALEGSRAFASLVHSQVS